MKVKIYQVEEYLDRYHTMFCCYDSVIQQAGRVDSSIYKTIFDGNVDVPDLEALYLKCNLEHPVGYNGHSLSPSDVVELEDGTCHFCDTLGFKELKDFDPSKTIPLEGRRMIVLEPHKAPYVMQIPDELEALQQAVGGYIEVTYPFDDNAILIGNEEAKLIGLEGNRRIGHSIYAGNLLIAADDGEGGTTDLTDEQISKYTQMFQQPEDISHEEVQGDMHFQFIAFS